MNTSQALSAIVVEEGGEIETQIASVLKATNNNTASLITSLDEFIKQKDIEVQAAINQDYECLVHSLPRLLDIKDCVSELNEETANLIDELKSLATNILAKKKDHLSSLKVAANLQSAVNALEDCSFVMNLAQRASFELGAKKYYACYRTLWEMQTRHLRKVYDYSFCREIEKWLPQMHAKIQEAALTDLKAWLAKVRESAAILGKLLMDQYKNRHTKFSKVSSTMRKRFTLFTANSMEIMTVEDTEFDILNNDHISITFTSLYQCLHIYDVMGKRSDFQAIYAENRSLQVNVILNYNVSVKSGDVKSFESWLHNIGGFFIVEYFVNSSPQNFHPRSASDLLWELATKKISEFLRENVLNSNDVKLLTDIKFLFVIFIQAMESYSYSVESLVEILFNLFYRYVDILKNEQCDRIESFLDQDDFVPMNVPNEAAWDNLATKFKFLQRDIYTNKRSLRSMPFSKSFPVCYDVFIYFIEEFYLFLEGIPQQNNELDDLAKKAVDSFLINTICRSYALKIENSDNLNQVIQILANLECYEQLSCELEEVLAIRRDRSHVKLLSGGKFKDAKGKCEYRIFELMNRKVDDFFVAGASHYNSSSERAAKKIQEVPSSYIQDTIKFLTVLWNTTLTYIVTPGLRMVHFEAFNHICLKLMGILGNPNGKTMNFMFLKNFTNDVAYLEKFMAELKDPNLFVMDSYTELKQTLAWLQSDNISEILDDAVRNRKYSRVDQHLTLMLASKLKDSSSDLVIKAKMKHIEEFIKTMKAHNHNNNVHQ